MDGRMDEVNGWKGVRMEAQIDGWMEGRKNGWMEGWIDR